MKRINSLLLLLVIFLFSEKITHSQISKLDKNDLESTMRNPWQSDRSQYVAQWLILGPIPAQWDEGFDTDYLIKAGGEASIHPVEGQTIKLDSGSYCQWKTLLNPPKTINLSEFFKGLQTEHMVCYAYGILNRTEAGHALLTLGSDDGVKVWLNGELIHRNHSYRGVVMDQDQVDVFLKKGDNYLMFKILNGSGGWGFTTRVMTDPSVILNDVQKPVVAIHDNPYMSAFILNSSLLTKTIAEPPFIKFSVYPSGGSSIFEKTIRCGDSIVINYASWPDGLYEIKYTYIDLHGMVSSEYLNWVKGDIFKLAQELVNSAPGNDARSPDDIIHRMLANMITDRLGGNLTTPDPNKFYLLHSPLMEYAEMKANKQIRPGGFIRLAYVDAIDGTPQFCRCYIPGNYDPSKKSALVVFLHGYNGDNPDYIHWWSVDKRHDTFADRYNYVLIEPHGRGNTQYSGIGDLDVLKCIQMAKEKLNIDDNRVYLTGESMGGGGTWLVGSTHPELFAAIAPVYGGWDHHNTMKKEDLEKLSETASYLLEKANTTYHFESLVNMPVLALHGDNDKTVDVENTRYLVRMLQRWGYDVRYIEVPGKGHESLGKGDVIYPWLLQHTRNSNPKQVRVRAADLRNASAYWVKITKRENGLKMMYVDAELLSNNIIQVNSDNVLEMELSPGTSQLLPDQPIKILWNGELYTFDKPIDNTITLSHKTVQQKMQKTTTIAGPISDFINTPFALVVGTISKDSLMRVVIRHKTDAFVSYWVNWQKFKPRVFYDTAITENQLKEYSLLLLGGPRENKIAERLTKSLPFSIKQNTISIQGKVFQADKAYIEAIYPSPFNAMRYIRLVAPTSYEGLFFYNPVNAEFANYDYSIVDGKIPNPAVANPEKKMALATGMFDYNWKLDTCYLNVWDNTSGKGAKRIVNKKLRVDIVNVSDPSPALISSYTGSYKIDQLNLLFKTIVENGKFLVQWNNSLNYTTKAISDSEFFVEGLNFILSFQKNTTGNDFYATIFQGNYRVKCTKTMP